LCYIFHCCYLKVFLYKIYEHKEWNKLGTN
jgi:hypothetical protein